MADLRTRYLGLDLRTPLVASASPLTGTLEGLRRLEAAGVGAVVLPSLFEEQLTHDQLELDRLLETTADHTGEAQSYFPELEDYNTGPWTYLDHITQAKRAVSVPVIASQGAASGPRRAAASALIERRPAPAAPGLPTARCSAPPGSKRSAGRASSFLHRGRNCTRRARLRTACSIAASPRRPGPAPGA